MKQLFIVTLLLTAACFGAMAQEPDSLKVVPHNHIRVDSTLVGRDIFSLMPSKDKGDAADVTVNQTEDVRSAMYRRMAENAEKKVSGYRIRIYFSNAKNAREESSEAVEVFRANFPGYAAYRIFVSPNFKVTVGDFRNKSEALHILAAVKAHFPAAFIVKENIEL